MEVTTPLDPDPDQLIRGTDPASDPDLLFAVFLFTYDFLVGEQVMEVTTPLASLLYKGQVKRKQREVVIRIRALNQC